MRAGRNLKKRGNRKTKTRGERKTQTQKVAVVTGATRGIGAAIAARLRADGHFVIGLGRDAKALNRLRREAGERGTAIACDVASEASVMRCFAEIRKLTPRIDFLINNAGMAHGLKNVDKLPVAEWRRVVDTNLTGMFLVTQQALGMMERGGVIVNTLSTASERPFAGMAAYNASKAGALGLTNVLREELRERGIRVTALVPGAVATEIWEQFWPEAPREKMTLAESLAEMVTGILALPEGTTVEQMSIGPASGTL